ncbi:unnamed protein product [Victoria cruziana]
MPTIIIDKQPSAGVEFQGNFTFYVFICCIMSAFGGLMFGYDIGISGGVTSMDDFLIEFFPKVYHRKQKIVEDNYCKYDNQYLQLFTSSLYMAAVFSTFFASQACKKYGRRPTMRAASLFFLVGIILNAAAFNLTMLIIGRILLGIEVGFANSLLITVGILVANLVNYRTSTIHPWGWCISLGGAAIPAIFLCVGSLFITETPTSLIQRAFGEAKRMVKKKLGSDNIDAEYNEIYQACQAANLVKDPFRKLANRFNRPPLIIAIVMQTIGFKNDASLLSSVITGLVNVLCTMVSVLYVDKVGRRVLLLESVVQMLISQGAIGTLLWINLKSANTLNHNVAIAVVVFVCTFVSCFAWSWGPLGWLIPSETFPLETRAAGYSFAVSSNMLFTFIIAQAFLSMLCHMRAGIFYFFLGWIIIISQFSHHHPLHLIESFAQMKGIPINEIDKIWRQHWYWKRFLDDEDIDSKMSKKQVLLRHIKQPSAGVEFQGKFTFYVFICCIMSAFGGLMFGYDIGISSGVTSMDDFLIEFFPKVYHRKQKIVEDNYCKYDNQYLQLFTSSLYMAALFSTFFASQACKKYGRRPTMRAASLFFLVGIILNAAAINLTMLILGRILLGIGVGFANSIAPARIRGGLNILFQLLITVGILVANLVNYQTSTIHPWGWRISLGGAAIPAILLCVGSLFIVETPTSLIQRGHLEVGKATLKKIRGTDDIDTEYNEIYQACQAANLVKDPFRKLANRFNRPPLIIAIVMQTIGFKNDASLLSSVITGLVNVLCTMVSVLYVDKVGRRVLLLESVVQMLISQGAIGTLLWINLKSANTLNHNVAIAVVVFVCTFVSCFAWSWGPLGWLIPSETFPLETRAVGYSFAVSSNMLFTFIIAQAFLSMLCHMCAGIFYFFSGWIIIMGLFVLFFLPETKGIPINEIDKIWRQHWYWKRFLDDEDIDSKIFTIDLEEVTMTFQKYKNNQAKWC